MLTLVDMHKHVADVLNFEIQSRLSQVPGEEAPCKFIILVLVFTVSPSLHVYVSLVVCYCEVAQSIYINKPCINHFQCNQLSGTQLCVL